MSSVETSGVIAALLVSILGVGDGAPATHQPLIALQEATFALTQLPENPKQYSLVISDINERVISATFSAGQLSILRSIMIDAEAFAANGEAVGANEAKTTRFADKSDSACVVEVEKIGTLSRLFLIFENENGKMTVDAGKVVRGVNLQEEGLFFHLLSRLDALLGKPPSART